VGPHRRCAFQSEIFDVLEALWFHGAAGPAMGGKSKFPAAIADDFVQARYQIRATHRRLQRRNQQPVRTPRHASGNRARSISADTVGHQPFTRVRRLEIAGEVASEFQWRVHLPGHAISHLLMQWSIIESKTGRSGRCTSANLACGALLTALLDQFRDQSRPPGLVTRTDPGAIVSMKKFIEQNQVPPVRIGVENLSTARRRTPAILTAQENTDEPARNLARNLP